MASKNNPKGRENNLVVQDLKSEILIYDLNVDKAYCLNETSALVWQSCDGKKTASEISTKLSQKLKSPVTENLVWLALEQLQKENLLDNSQEIKIDFKGLSRREAIKKVGFASMVALPVISSLVAPTAAMAQSVGACIAAGNPCTPANPDPCCAGAICEGTCFPT